MSFDDDFDRAISLARQTGNSELVDLVYYLMAQTWVVLGERDDQWKAIQMLREEIDRLEGLLETKCWTGRWGEAVFAVESHGEPIGEPHCQTCFEINQELVSVVRNPTELTDLYCPRCNSGYSARSVALPDRK